MTDTTKAPFRVKRPASVTEVKDEKGASDNFSAPHISMTFNVDPVWHSRFKVEAAIRGITMKELFLECFALYEKQGRKSGR